MSLLTVTNDTIVYAVHPNVSDKPPVVWQSRTVFHRALKSPEQPTECDCDSAWRQAAICGHLDQGCEHGSETDGWQAVRFGDLNLGRSRPCLSCWPEMRLP